MRKKRAIILWSICLAGILFFTGQRLYEECFAPVPFAYKEMGVALLEDTSFLETLEKRTAETNELVFFEQVLLPYDSSEHMLYLSQGTESEKWLGELSAGGDYFLCSALEDGWQDKNTAIAQNHIVTLWVLGEDHYYEFQMAVSGMPVIAMTTTREEEPEPVDYEVDPDAYIYDSETRYYGTMNVFDPVFCESDYDIYQLHMRYHYKGNSSKSFEKKGYSLKLLDYEEEKVNVPLLGMRSDNNWKLNALYTDENRIREITASQVWEEFDAANEEVDEPGPRMEYVELIVDNDYKGLYCLVEPVDEKKLELTEEDTLYKIINWTIPEEEDMLEAMNNGWKVQQSIRIRYPDEITDYESVWSPIIDYLNTFYVNESINYEEAGEKINISNYSDYFMFLMTMTISDNGYKNIYYVADKTRNGYQMRVIPWDLDFSFGNVFDYNASDNCVFSTDLEGVYVETALPRLKIANPEEIGPEFYERYCSYRESFLSTEHICTLLTANQQYIVKTGALARENTRWPECGVTDDIRELLEFQKNRMAWLDDYFLNWSLGY